MHTVKTRMHIYVSVKLSDPKKDTAVVTKRCFIIFRAVDEAGYFVQVPSFIAESEEDKN
ncbi:MAG: acyl-CoA hydrolase [Kangiellaceae bacterium]